MDLTGQPFVIVLLITGYPLLGGVIIYLFKLLVDSYKAWQEFARVADRVVAGLEEHDAVIRELVRSNQEAIRNQQIILARGN